MELLLLRHSITPGNLKRQYIGSTDQPLAPEGEALARKRRGEMPEIGGLWVSPMLRCRQTAALLFPGVEQRQVPQLRECAFGRFEEKTWEELKDDPLYRAWMGGDLTITFPGGENMQGFLERSRRGIEAVVREAEAAGVDRGAVVAHGGTWLAVMSAFGRPEWELYRLQPENCRGWRVEVRREPLELRVLEAL